MGQPRPAWQRLITWPARRAYRVLEGLRRRRWHGLARPGWWPRERAWPFGPSYKHDGRQVTVFVGGQRYEFVPMTYGRHRGHMYTGRLRPNAVHLAERLAALSLDPAAAELLAAVSSLEGGFDALQTYAKARFAWGFIQFTGTGGLPGVMHLLKVLEPERFHRYFRAGGIDVEPGMLVVDANGRRLRGGRALNRLHDEPALWKHFLLGAQDPAVQDVQLRAAYEHYLLRAREVTVTLGGHAHRLGELLAGHPLGHAVLLDRAVYRGLAHTRRLFQRAARHVDLRSPARAADLLAAARRLEPNDQARWDALQRALAATRRPTP